jgi:hypothetical protein
VLKGDEDIAALLVAMALSLTEGEPRPLPEVDCDGAALLVVDSVPEMEPVPQADAVWDSRTLTEDEASAARDAALARAGELLGAQLRG